jgi:predicted anti-sigma-YlaC factor YlaD
VSAALDGEQPGLAQAEVDAHLATCPECRAFAEGAVVLNRSVRVRAAEAVPDLTAAILGPPPRLAAAGGGAPPAWARYGLLTVAATVLILALPVLFSGGGPHDGRDLAAFEVALCAALLLVVWQPQRAAGLLPMGATLAVASLASAAVDVVNGNVGLDGEANHVLVLVGLGLLWVMARPESQRAAHTALT